MGDAGEGLIDAEDRFQQWVAEREQQRQRKGVASADPERERRLNSLRLAKAELERQQAGDHERDPPRADPPGPRRDRPAAGAL